MMINLFDRIKLLFCKEKELYSALYGILGFYPRSLDYYKVALTHKSHGFRSQQGRLLNNERLEFLGDAVLETVVSDIVYRKFERKDEGFLTTTRSKIVQRETLNRLAVDLGLDRLVKKEGRDTTSHNNMYGNAFEALVGAVYLDRGFKWCMWFFQQRILHTHIDMDALVQSEKNFKSRLIEWCQKNKAELVFRLKSDASEGGNTPVFRTEVLVEQICAGRGRGYSKKESQQQAAQDALRRIRHNAKFVHLIYAARDKRLHPPTESEAAADQPAAVPKPEKPNQSARHRKWKNVKDEGGQPLPATVAVELSGQEAGKAARPPRKRDKEEDGQGDAAREAIIRAAEEAAFWEHAAASK